MVFFVVQNGVSAFSLKPHFSTPETIPATTLGSFDKTIQSEPEHFQVPCVKIILFMNHKYIIGWMNNINATHFQRFSE